MEPESKEPTEKQKQKILKGHLQALQCLGYDLQVVPITKHAA